MELNPGKTAVLALDKFYITDSAGLDEFEIWDKEAQTHEFNTYMIVSLPKIGIIHAEMDNYLVHIHIKNYENGSIETFTLDTSGREKAYDRGYTNWSIKISDDGTKLYLCHEANRLRLFHVYHFVKFAHGEQNGDVLYVGQSLGKYRGKGIRGRLAKHENIQKIYFTEMRKGKNRDIHILLMFFKYKNIVMFTEPSKKAHADIFSSPYGTDLSQKVNMSEIGLIKLFDPIYNTEFSSKDPQPFPKFGRTKYDEYYKMGYDAVLIDFDFTDYGLRIGTATCGFHDAWGMAINLIDETLESEFMDIST